MSSKIAKRQLREMGAVLAAPQMGNTGGKSSTKIVAFAPSKGVFAAPNVKSVKVCVFIFVVVVCVVPYCMLLIVVEYAHGGRWGINVILL